MGTNVFATHFYELSFEFNTEKMKVLEHLASTMGRRDEVPNQELAQKIATENNQDAVQQLIDHLKDKNKDIQHDCIKVLYEIGTVKPNLISSYAHVFKPLLHDKNNRLQWGAMTALSTIVSEKPEVIYAMLPALADVASKGSVITKDNYIAILIKLCAYSSYKDAALTLLYEQFLTCPSNQLPMYAENASAVIGGAHKQLFIKTLTARLDDFEKASKRTRVEKVLKKLSK